MIHYCFFVVYLCFHINWGSSTQAFLYHYSLKNLQFGVVIFRLKTCFVVTDDDQCLPSHSIDPIQPQDDNGRSEVVTDEQITDDSPPLGSIGGGQRNSIQPLIPSSSPNLADS